MASVLHPIAARDNAKADVIFVHGLGGHPFSTWQPQGHAPKDIWPYWLAAANEEISVYCLEYEAEPLAWLGSSLPLVDRATEIFTILEIDDIGTKPIIWVTHSFGGLLVKQILRHADDQNTPAWQQVIEQTRSVLFFATPHAGADLATWLESLGAVARATDVIKDLRAHSHHLANLNEWFRSEVIERDMKIECFFETKATYQITVVNRASADPGIANAKLRPVDKADHIEICKPKSPKDFRCRILQKTIKDSLRRPLSKRAAADQASPEVGTIQSVEGDGNVVAGPNAVIKINH